MLSDDKLNKIRKINSNDYIWYVTKQCCNFRDLCYVAELLELWNDDEHTSYQAFFDNNKVVEPYKTYISGTPHRATINCSLFGLLTPSEGRSQYSSKNLTEVYFYLKKICNGDFSKTDLYQNYIDKQLEKIYISNKYFNINPVMFTLKILLLLGDITSEYKISIQEFKLFVATATKWNDYYETVQSILRFREDENFKQECLKELNNVSDVRYNRVLINHSYIEESGNNLSLKDEGIWDCRKRIAEYELQDSFDVSEDIKQEMLTTIQQKFNSVEQKIYFGAPGTGKSHKINKTEGMTEKNSIRTTFHPDSDYSTFVGCYKPVKKQIPNDYADLTLSDFKAIADEINKKTGEKVSLTIDFVSKYAVRLSQIVEETEDIKSLNQLLIGFGFSNDTYLCKVISKTIEDLKNNADITYEFIPQAFTTAYVNAWKNLDKPYYLVIEEINRGNCAQIFGDIFQLLDRDNETGYSSYKIAPDKDLQCYLATQFKDCNIDQDIKSGEKMQLPNNLNILATMNTSDQSLFPIDSAFKRRWDWQYIPINPIENKAFIVKDKYSWNSFLKIVNDHIESITLSEDKKMGAWFVKADNNGCISAEKFVSKVVFYLWNDIFKDLGHDGKTIFKDDYKSFHKFFEYDGSVNTDVLMKFLNSFNIDSENKTEESQA